MSYPGGKAGGGAYQKIINQIPPHDVYIEPFLGGGAVMLAKRPADRSTGIDLDSEALAAFSAGEGLPPGLELYRVDAIEWLRHAFGLYRWPTSAARDSAAPPGRAEDAGFGGPRGQVFVYADPPYPRGSRRSKERLYRHEMSDAQHAELLEVLAALPCPVAVSSYPNRLYERRLADWRRIEFQIQTRGGSMATEVLWMNYGRPDELHDYRYLGDEKRERERIRRKVRTWSAGLKRLPPHERQAILSELIDRDGTTG